MNIYELMNHYWNSAAEEPFSSSETALYFLLLKIANDQHWQDSFTCSTTTLCMLLDMSKQNFLKVRTRLVEREMITVVQGTGKRYVSTYSFVLPACDKKANGQQMGKSWGKLQLTPKLTLYKNNKKKDDTNNNIEDGGFLKTMEELKELLSADEAWQVSVITALGSAGIRTTEEINRYLSRFFLELAAKGTTQREEADCKAHFFNWLNKRINNNHIYGNKQYANKLSQRRAVEVSTGTAEDYEGRF